MLKLSKRTLTTEEKELRAMAMQANRQLTSLEKNKMRSAPAYRSTQKQYFSKSKTKYLGKNKYRPRFRTDVGNMSQREKNVLRTHVEEYLDMKTSTVEGVHEMYDKGKAKFESVWGDTLGYDEYLNMWEKGITEEFVKIFGSSQIAGLLSTMTAEGMNKQQMEDFLKDNKEEKTINDLYNNLGLEPREKVDDKRISFTNNNGFYKV